MPRPRVLLIEDDAYLARILQDRLAEAGMDGRRAGNGDEGLRQAQQEAPDAIVLGLVLQRKNGFEVLEALRERPETASIPVIMLTAMSSKEDIERCRALGACEYLIKSQHSAEEIVERIRRRLRVPTEGFALVEGLVVLAVIVAAVAVAFYQSRVFEARERDAERLASLRTAVSALAAASQEKLILAGCGGQSLLADCRLCKTGACRGDEDRTAEFLPRDLFAADGNGEACSAKPGRACRWSVEADGSEGMRVDRYQIRFYLEKGMGDGGGPRAFVIYADGRIE